MQKTLTWLFGGVAVALAAGTAMAQDPRPKDAQTYDPHETIRQAAEDARAASGRAHHAAEDARDRAAEAHEHARDGKGKVRREVRVYRHGEGKPGFAFHGGADRTERLRTLLQLRPEQETALKAYVEAVGKGPQKDQVVHFDRGSDARTTPQRLADMEARMAEQQAAMTRRIGATNVFYAQLDEKQRKVFDAMPMLMFAGPGFGPMPVPVAHVPHPPQPPTPPRAPRS